ncbi:MAG: calcium-binding protein [Pseudomonadota bacterium]
MTSKAKEVIDLGNLLLSTHVTTSTELMAAATDAANGRPVSSIGSLMSGIAALGEFVDKAGRVVPWLGGAGSLLVLTGSVSEILRDHDEGDPIKSSNVISAASSIAGILGLVTVGAAATAMGSLLIGAGIIAASAITFVSLTTDDPEKVANSPEMQSLLDALNLNIQAYALDDFEIFVNRFFNELELDNGYPILGGEALHHILMEAVDPELSPDEVESLVAQFSHRDKKGVEGFLRAMEAWSLNGDQGPVSNEEAYFSRLLTLYSQLGDGASRTVTSLAGVGISDLLYQAGQDNDSGRAHRYAMMNLLPFTILGDHSGTESAQDIYDLSAMSDNYLHDRALTYLAWHDQTARNTAHPSLIEGEPLYIVDRRDGTTLFAGQLEFAGGSVAYQSHEVPNLTFGSELRDFMGGGSADDRFYGQGGNDELHGREGDDHLEGGLGDDHLQGDQGDDYLEGGEGNDLYVYGLNDGKDVIADVDKNGTILIKISDYGQVYRTMVNDYGRDGDDGWSSGETMLTFDGANLVATFERADGSITFQDFQNGDFGIWLLGRKTGEIYNQLYEPDDAEYFEGTAGQDEIYGGSREGTVNGGAGDDVIYSRYSSPNRILMGGLGDDQLFGLNGNRLLGGEGNDMLKASGSGLAGITLMGGNGHDSLQGNAGDDRLEGEAGQDSLYGGGGDDLLLGGTGHDYYGCGLGINIDRIRDEGQNTLYFEIDLLPSDITFIQSPTALNLAIGGPDDVVSLEGFILDDVTTHSITHFEFADGASYSMPEMLELANLAKGTSADNVFNGTVLADALDGGAGNDTLTGFGGDDTLAGGSGADYLDGGDGADRLEGGKDADELWGFAGNDTLLGGSGDDRLFGDGDIALDLHGDDLLKGQGGNDELYGAAGVDTLVGGSGDDVLQGDAGGDSLKGGSGNDSLRGGLDGDKLRGGAGDDSYFFAAGDGRDTVNNNDVGDLGLDRLYMELVEHDELWLSRKGQHLLVDVIGSEDQLKIRNWFKDGESQIDEIHAADGVLLRNQVDQLVNAMAAFDVPDGVGAVMPAEVRSELAPVLAASWA